MNISKNLTLRLIWNNKTFIQISIILTLYHTSFPTVYYIYKHFNFNRDNPLSRMFNRNTVKISYSCTKIMYNILSNHIKRLLNELIMRDRNPDVGFCNCRNKEECPLGGRCNSRNVIYQACISPMKQQRDGRRVYIGISTGKQPQTFIFQPKT